jgi:hypothetical protein
MGRHFVCLECLSMLTESDRKLIHSVNMIALEPSFGIPVLHTNSNV